MERGHDVTRGPAGRGNIFGIPVGQPGFMRRFLAGCARLTVNMFDSVDVRVHEGDFLAERRPT